MYIIVYEWVVPTKAFLVGVYNNRYTGIIPVDENVSR